MSSTVLTIKPSFLLLSSDQEDLLEGIYETLSFRDPSKAYTWGGRFDADRIVTVRFSKYVEDLDLPTIKVPIGFLEFVQSVLKDYEHTVVDDQLPLQEISVEDIENLEGIELQEHQLGAIVASLQRRRGIVMAPTGSGKTEIFLAILNMLEEPSLVLFNRQQLTQQTFDRAHERGLDVGIVQGPNVMEKRITMATIQSIEKLESIRKYKNLILDEVHNVGGKSYQKILKLAHWQRVYGFSATPVNPKKMDLKSAKIIANVGPVIFEAKAKDMMEAEIISKPKIYMVPVDQPDDIEDYNYKEAEMSGIIYNKHRNNLIKKIAEHHRGEGVDRKSVV
jgi:superfamily II DNA or RNA helicase